MFTSFQINYFIMSKDSFKLGIANEGFVANFGLSTPVLQGVFNKDAKDGRNHDYLRLQLKPVSDVGEERIVMMSDDQMAYIYKKFRDALVEVEEGRYQFNEGWAISCTNHVLSCKEIDAE